MKSGPEYKCRSSWRRSICAVLALLVGAFAAPPVNAGTGNVVTFPLPGVKNRSGLRMEIDCRGPMGSGYRPVRVRISSQPFGPAPADRTLEIELRPRGWNGTRAGAVTGTVELKQGDTFGEVTLSIPQTNFWSMMEVETREGGWKLRDLSTNSMGLMTRYYNTSPDNTPTIVVVHWAADDRTMQLTGGSTTTFKPHEGKISYLNVDQTLVGMPGGLGTIPFFSISPNSSAATISGMGVAGMPMSSVIDFDSLPDIRVLAGRFPEAYVNSYGAAALEAFSTQAPASDSALERLVNDMPNLDMIPPNLLPDKWLDYTSIDLMLISRMELKGLKEQFPEKWSALRTWMISGSTLCVYDAGEDFSQITEISELMGLDATPAMRSGNPWIEPSVSEYSDTIDATKSVNGAISWWQQQQMAQGKMASSQGGVLPAPSKKPFMRRNAGRGQLVVMAARNPFPGTEMEWNWLFNSVPSRNWLSFQRHGMSHYQDNLQFWNFLVEGIGRAPVKSFLALITVFAIVIGPINYFALHRRGRLYLLLVTVPAGAILISGGLFLFAMVGDGLGTRARLRSYTELDQRKKASMSWTRQTYYAGFAPSRGLSFPAEAAVYPVEHRPVSSSGIEDTSRALVWTDRQDLVAGYFTSRTMSQFVTVEPMSTEAAIKVEESANEAPQVTNELGVTVEALVLRDSHGDLYETGELRSGEKVTATKANREDRGADFRLRYRENRPAYPEGFDPNSLDDVSQFFGRNWRYQSNLAPPAFETSVMEQGIREALDKDFDELSEGSYVCILRRSPFVSMGVESVIDERGFHVVRGRW